MKQVLDRFGKRLIIVVTELDTGKERHLTPEEDPHLPVRVAVRMSMGKTEPNPRNSTRATPSNGLLKVEAPTILPTSRPQPQPQPQTPHPHTHTLASPIRPPKLLSTPATILRSSCLHRHPTPTPRHPTRPRAAGVPGLMEPVAYRGHVYCDGGMTNDFPIDALPDEPGKRIGLVVRTAEWISYAIDSSGGSSNFIDYNQVRVVKVDLKKFAPPRVAAC